MQNCWTVLLVVFGWSTMLSQNLVPNPGFELVVDNPVFSPSGVNTSIGWFAGKGSTDFFHKEFQDNYRPPATYRGYQSSASGDGHAGIFVNG